MGRRRRERGPLRRAADLVAYAAVRTGLAALRAPSLRFARRAGEAAGALAWRANATRRRRAQENVRHAFPSLAPAEQERIVRASFQSVFRTFVEVAWCSRLAPAERARLVRFEGEEHVRRALEGGRGAVLFSGHLGNWEIIAAAFEARFGRPLVGLVKRIHDRRLDAVAELTRRRLGLVPIDLRGALREGTSRLREGACVAVVGDQAFPRGVVVRSFGRPVAMSAGPVVLARRARAALVPYEGRSVEDGFVVRFHAPVLGADATRDEPTEAVVARLSAVLDGLIDKAPGEWLWFHRRWRDLPEHGIAIDAPATWPVA